MIDRRMVLMGVASAATLASASIIASAPAAAQKAEVFTGIVKGVAVGGYDPVSYFTAGKPISGNQDITLEHKGAVWRFSSEQNRDAFEADPAKYAPQYGGYCAWAVSQGYTAKGDPNAWAVVNGRLYLNYDKKVQATWNRNAADNVSKADQKWPTVLKK